MIKHLIPLISCLCLMGAHANALSRCDVVSGLQRVQLAQQRLAAQPAKIRASRDRGVLNRELQTLTALNIAMALGNDIEPEERTLLFAVLDSARMFQDAVDNGNTQLAVDIFSAPAFQRRMTQLAYLIPRFDCHLVSPAGLPGNARALHDIAIRVEAKLLRHEAIAIAGVVVLAGLLLLIAARKAGSGIRQQRRRSRRHRIYMPIHFIAHQKIARGILMDVSCNGVKLQHNGTQAKVGETLDIWILDDWQKGTIAWSNAHYCGVDFAFPILYSQVRALRGLNLPQDRQQKTAPEPDAV